MVMTSLMTFTPAFPISMQNYPRIRQNYRISYLKTCVKNNNPFNMTHDTLLQLLILTSSMTARVRYVNKEI